MSGSGAGARRVVDGVPYTRLESGRVGPKGREPKWQKTTRYLNYTDEVREGKDDVGRDDTSLSSSR